MKYTLLFWLLPAAAAFGQPVVSDTTFFSATGGAFTRTQTRTYEDGRAVTETTKLDSAQLFDNFLGRIQAEANAVANVATEAIKRNRAANEMRRYDTDVVAAVGVSPADSIAREIFRTKLQGKQLEWDSAGVIVPAQVNPRAQGGFNLRVNTKNYRLQMYEPRWIRVQNYPSQGSTVDLWLYQGKYQSFDGRHAIQGASGTKLRFAAPPKQ